MQNNKFLIGGLAGLLILAALSLLNIGLVFVAAAIYVAWHQKSLTLEGIGKDANLYSFAIGVPISLIIGVSAVSIVEIVGAWMGVSLTFLVRFLASLAVAATFYVKGFKYEVPVAHGAVPKLFGFLLHLELRTGQVWTIPFVMELSRCLSTAINRSRLVTVKDPAPDNILIEESHFLWGHVTHVFRALGVDSPEDTLLQVSESDARTFIRSREVLLKGVLTPVGAKAVEKQDQKDNLHKYLEQSLLDECEKVGYLITKIYVVGIHAPGALQESALQVEIEKAEAAAKMVKTKAFAKRVQVLSDAEVGISAETAANIENGGERKVWAIENIGKIADTLGKSGPAIAQLLTGFEAILSRLGIGGGGSNNSGRQNNSWRRGNRNNRNPNRGQGPQQQGGPHGTQQTK